MSCEYGYYDCGNENKKCDGCIEGLRYNQIRKKNNIHYAKENKRQGSGFEAYNHNKTSELLSGASTRLTPNSGAGFVKGDEEIQGIISCMEELKEGYCSRGKNTFTVQKDWFEKLDREGAEAHKEFWYLKFRFKDDSDYYNVIKSDSFMGLLYTLQEDRKAKKEAELKRDIIIKSKEVLEKENVTLTAKISELQTKIELLNLQLKKVS